MGDPIKIAQMACELIKLTGREPNTEIEIRYVGLRAGEKLFEELITVGEGIVATHHEKIMVLRGKETLTCKALNNQLEFLAQNARELNSKGIKEVLQEIIPEYSPDYSVK